MRLLHGYDLDISAKVPLTPNMSVTAKMVDVIVDSSDLCQGYLINSMRAKPGP